ncbi:MAG: YPDG domain-containing protein [Actinomycetaceae bacterium]|nr:YPDG domain-containing protein [Actinomycetaceae bacterium]
MQQYGQTNVVVRGNYVKGAGGDSITVFYALRPLVEYNVSVDGSKHMNTTDYPAGTSFGRVAAGIWPWKTKDAVFQYNEAYNTLNAAHGNGDGMPWDSDWSDGTLYQYNYSASNTGGTYMICGVEAVNSTFRYNISQNDVGGLLDPVDRNPNGHIYNNTFYIAPDVPILKTQHNPNGRATIENNIFYYTGTTPRQENWTRGDGGGFQKLWKNNLYYNYSNTPATDTEPIKVPAGTQVFAEQDVKLAPETARVDYLTYRLPGTNEAATTRSATQAARVTRAVVDSDPFGGYRLTDTSPAADSGKTIQDENGFAPEADFFGTPLAGATDMGAVQHRSADDADSNKSIVSTIYLLTPDSRNAQNIHVPQTDNNPTPVSEVVANVKVSPLAHASVVDAEGSAVAADAPIADGMKLRITAEDGTFNDIPLVVTNEYSWVDNYVNNQQGNVWFGQRQMSADGQWFNIDTYDPTWPNWQVDRYFGPGVTGSRNLPVVGERDSIHGLLSDSPDTPGDSTAMAFRAPKTGTVTFTVKDDEPQLRQDGNTNGTVRLSLYKNGEELQSVELSQSKVTAEDWNNFTAENPITVKQGDYLRVVAHSVGAPTKPSLWISPVIEYIDVAPSVDPDPEPVAVVALEPVWDDESGSFTVPSVEGITYSLDGDVLAPGGVVDGLAGKRVVVTAAAGEGYTLSEDSPLEFIHEFPAPSVEPDPEPDPGTDPDEPNVDPEHPGTDPDEPGVDPDQPGTDPGEPTVDPEPEPTMVKLTDPVSNVVPEAEDPASCTVKPFVDITEVEGVEYFLNDVRVEPGIVEYGYGETVVVEAKALDGYAFDKDVVTSWEWTSPTWESLKCDPTEPDPTDADSFIVGLPMLDDLQGIEGDEVSFNGVAIPEDQELPEGTRFSAEGLPEGLTIDAETGEVSGMLPEVDRTTEFEVTVTVTYPDLSADVVEYVYAVSPVDEAEPVVPPTESDDPAEDPDAPGTDPGEQGSDPADPGVDPEIPSTDPADPATDPKDPGAGSDKPDTDSENPGGNPEEPTTGEPGTGGDNPATADDQPGTEPSIPTEPDVSGGDGEDRVVEPFAPHTNVLPDATDPASCTVKPFVEITGIEGVEYFLNGLRVQPGIIEYGYGETVIVEAKPREGFAFPEGAVTKWEWTAPSWESLQCAGDEPQTPLVPARDPKLSTDGLSSSTRFETLPRNSALANSGASGLAWMGAVALALSAVGLAGVARRKVQRSS